MLYTNMYIVYICIMCIYIYNYRGNMHIFIYIIYIYIMYTYMYMIYVYSIYVSIHVHHILFYTCIVFQNMFMSMPTRTPAHCGVLSICMCVSACMRF